MNTKISPVPLLFILTVIFQTRQFESLEDVAQRVQVAPALTGMGHLTVQNSHPHTIVFV